MELPEEERDAQEGGSEIRALIQRVSEGAVKIEGERKASIGRGMVVLLGIRKGDGLKAAAALANKVAGLRIFPDEKGKMGLSLGDIKGEVLVVSQMTLYGDCSKGRRPSFDEVASGGEAEPLYAAFLAHLKSAGLSVATGVFGAMQEVTILNDGPVTFMLEA